jgi:superoxide reductase
MRTTRGQVFKCPGGDTVIEVLQSGEGELQFHGQPMQVMGENTVDASKEKHVPVIEKIPGGYKVKVGVVPHPMEAAHFIEWIELLDGDQVHRQYLKPGMAPEAEFRIETSGGKLTARGFCNLHGLWKS